MYTFDNNRHFSKGVQCWSHHAGDWPSIALNPPATCVFSSSAARRRTGYPCVIAADQAGGTKLFSKVMSSSCTVPNCTRSAPSAPL